MLEERSIVIFCYCIDQIVKGLSKNQKSGKSYKAFIKAGLSDHEMYLLRKLNLIDYDEDKPSKAVWIVWKNIKEQRIQWFNEGYRIPIDCNELKTLGPKKYKEQYLQNIEYSL